MNRTATVNLDTPHGFEPRFRFTFVGASDGLPVDLTGADVELEIYENNLVSIFASDSGVGGAIAVSGNAIDIVISDLFTDYHEAIREWPAKQYRYRIDINGDYRIQGAWRSLIRAGKAADHDDEFTVEIGAVVIEVSISSIVPQIPAPSVRVMTSSGPVTLLDSTVLLRAGSGSVTAALPDPASAFGSNSSLIITLARPIDDNNPAGQVAISGTGPELPEILYPGESLWLQSDGSAWHVIG